MVEILIGVASFAGGGFLTAIVFIVGYTGRLTTVEESIKNIKDKLDNWEKNGMPPCSYHQGIETRLRESEIRIGQIKIGQSD